MRHTFKHLLLFAILSIPLAIVCMSLQAHTAYAKQAVPLGSCGDTVADDAQLFGNRVADVLAQAQAMNTALQADTRVVTVAPEKLAGRSLSDYYYFVQGRCPAWAGQNFAVLVVAKGYDPFLHLGSTFNGKLAAADYQQITLSNRSLLAGGNYAQGAINVLQQVQKKLSPNYTWLWVTLVVVALLIAGAVLAFVFLRRRQSVAAATGAREQAVAAKQAAVNITSSLGRKSQELAPRIEVLLALLPPATATQLQRLFEASKAKESRVEEHLGNLLSNPATNLDGKTTHVEQYTQMQRSYQQVYTEAQEPQYLQQGIESIVARLERNPQESIDFRQLTTANSRQSGLSRL